MSITKIEDELATITDDSLITLIDNMKHLKDFNELNRLITRFVKSCDKEVILMIDECDESTNNDVFLKFLSVLRNKYLRKIDGRDVTFKSVILAGVHDIKNMKYHIRGNDESANSPWNIAENFNVDMSFNEAEIQSLLEDYLFEDKDIKMDVELIAEKIHYFTNGYPFLVSYLCKVIDEDFEGKDKWSVHNLEQAVNELLLIKMTNFDSLINNIENHEDLASLVRLILIEGKDIPYSISDPAMEKGLMYGVLMRSKDNKLTIHNPIYEMKIYSYYSTIFQSKLSTAAKFWNNSFASSTSSSNPSTPSKDMINNKTCFVSGLMAVLIVSDVGEPKGPISSQ